MRETLEALSASAGKPDRKVGMARKPATLLYGADDALPLSPPPSRPATFCYCLRGIVPCAFDTVRAAPRSSSSAATAGFRLTPAAQCRGVVPARSTKPVETTRELLSALPTQSVDKILGATAAAFSGI